MKKKGLSFTKRTLGTVLALALAFQPCLLSSAYAAAGDYSKDKNYPTWDDPESQSSYYWDEDVQRKVTNVTKSYDDGKKYTATYKYNTNGDMIDARINESDGTTITIKRVYQGENLVSSSLSEYNASDKSQSTQVTQYGDDTTPTYDSYHVQYADNTFESEEDWYYGSSYYPIRKVYVARDGRRTETDYSYAEDGYSPLLVRSISSDGTERIEEVQYDDSLNAIYFKKYYYYAESGTTATEEFWREGDSDTGVIRSLDTTVSATGETHRSETWRRAKDGQTTKTMITYPDGSQTTESYSYNQTGAETLYTRVEKGETTKRRETVYTQNETTVTYTDGEGLRSVTRESTDPKTELETDEKTVYYADGSYSYEKKVYNTDTWDILLDITRERDANGTETYAEFIYAEDGSKTMKVKERNGNVRTVSYDSDNNVISRIETLPNGTTKEIFREYQEDGYHILQEVSRYSDGGEDVQEYELNENNDLTKITETRRNGISAVTLVGKDEDYETYSMVFSSGYSLDWKTKYINSSLSDLLLTYSHGDIAQDRLTINEFGVHVSTTYRDERVENITTGPDDENYSLMEKKQMDMFSDRMEAFLEKAWELSPDGAAAPQTATSGNGSPVVVAGGE